MRHERLKANTVKGALEETRQQIRRDERDVSPEIRDFLEEISRGLDDSEFNASTLEGVTPEGLGRFRLETGHDANAYVDQRRLEIAHHLVCNTEVLLNTLSEGLGFRTPDLFSKWFKRRMGLAPEAVRRALRRPFEGTGSCEKQRPFARIVGNDESLSEHPDWPGLERWRLFMMGLIGPEEAVELAEVLESRYNGPER